MISTAIRNMPPELQSVMLEFYEALDVHFSERYAVRREDFDELRAVVSDLAAAQKRTEARVEELAEAQKRTEQRVEELAEAQKRTEQRVEELAEAEKRTEERLTRLEAAMAELAEAQKRAEERLTRLDVAMAELAEAQKEMRESLSRLTDRTARLEGRMLERDYAEKAYAFFGRLLRRAQAISLRDLEEQLESYLSDAEMADLAPLDVLIRGRARHLPEAPEIWLALEVSSVVDVNDVERARRRAALLRKARYVAIPTVAGEDVTEGAAEACLQHKVFLVQNGQHLYWNEALSQVLTD